MFAVNLNSKIFVCLEWSSLGNLKSSLLGELLHAFGFASQCILGLIERAF
jgi:hypothetical protein